MARQTQKNFREYLLSYVRFALITLWFAFSCIIWLPCTAILYRQPKNNLRFLRIFVPVARRILGLKVETVGVENMPKNSIAVFVQNHQDSLDLLLNADFYPAQCVVMGKRELLYIPVFGWMFYLCGNILVRRANHANSMEKMLQIKEQMDQQKISLWIFPEGTRSKGSGIGEFKRGAFHLAASLQCPVVPIVASNYVNQIDYGKWRSGKIKMHILKPISPTDFANPLAAKATLGETPEKNSDNASKLVTEMIRITRERMIETFNQD